MDARAGVRRAPGQRPRLDEVDGAVRGDGPLDVLRAAEQLLHPCREGGDLLRLVVGEDRPVPQRVRHRGHPRAGLTVGGRPHHAPLGDDLGADRARLGIDEEVVDVRPLLHDPLADPAGGGDDVMPRTVARVPGERHEGAGPGHHPLDRHRDPRARGIDALRGPVPDGLGLERRRPAARHRLRQLIAADVQEAVAHPGERVVLGVLSGAVLPRHDAPPHGGHAPRADALVEGVQQPCGVVSFRHGLRQRRRGGRAPVRDRHGAHRRDGVPQPAERPVELGGGQAEEVRDGEPRRAQRLQPRELAADLVHAHHTPGTRRGFPAAYPA
ncbi:hypothetical protein [Actinomadura sp. KC345]|uniref:hypothetical protein n=1 Tax=Actinomadura sp. KC345 TaxID=2530371 RepID=UPI001FB7700E|nr:hypothetical protein [Actinomadura sp. KC345]